ncbi:DUF4405 domain-containing protein [bacterium]|nr:DUF4405 domain-containing protein [bacterium]
MKKRTTTALVSTILLILVVIVVITGIIKMPLSSKIIGADWTVPEPITKIHTVSGILMTVFTILHIWLYFSVFKSGLIRLLKIAKGNK